MIQYTERRYVKTRSILLITTDVKISITDGNNVRDEGEFDGETAGLMNRRRAQDETIKVQRC